MDTEKHEAHEETKPKRFLRPESWNPENEESPTFGQPGLRAWFANRNTGILAAVLFSKTKRDLTKQVDDAPEDFVLIAVTKGKRLLVTHKTTVTFN